MLDLLCAILREGAFQWPDIDETGAVRLYEVAREHGIHLLVAERVWQRGALKPGSPMRQPRWGGNDCPPVLRDRLVAALRNQLGVEEIARQELRSVLGALNDAGIAALLFKGTALAYTHYQDAALRPRFDTDVLIDTSEIQSACGTLERLGYQRLPFTSGDLVMYQAPYRKTDRRGVRHTIDVHWKISNPQVFASVLTKKELWPRSTTIAALGNGARAMGSVDALVLACIHRVAHHGDEERLIWIYDIHLISERLAAAEQQEFVELVQAKELTAVCAAGLALAEQKFLGRGAASLLARLAPQSAHRGAGAPGSRTTRERSEIYVTGKMRKVDVLVSDLKALQGWRSRIKLLREHVLPPPSYMRQVYGISNNALLPIFYAWRFARGAREWSRGSGPRDST